MPSSIKHGSYHLIESNSFFTIDSGETHLRVEYAGDAINFIFDIVNDDSDVKNSIQSKIEASDTLKITIRNYKQVMGNSVVGPTDLGQIAGKRFSMILQVSGARSDQAKLITYSIYVEEGN